MLLEVDLPLCIFIWKHSKVHVRRCTYLVLGFNPQFKVCSPKSIVRCSTYKDHFWKQRFGAHCFVVLTEYRSGHNTSTNVYYCVQKRKTSCDLTIGHSWSKRWCIWIWNTVFCITVLCKMYTLKSRYTVHWWTIQKLCQSEFVKYCLPILVYFCI